MIQNLITPYELINISEISNAEDYIKISYSASNPHYQRFVYYYYSTIIFPYDNSPPMIIGNSLLTKNCEEIKLFVDDTDD